MKNHIINGSRIRGGHDWSAFNINPNDPDAWGKILPLLQETVRAADKYTASPTPNGDIVIQYAKYFEEYGHSIGVRLFSDSPNVFQLSDAYPLY